MYMHLASFRGPGHDWQAAGTEQVSHKCALNRQGTKAVIADQKHTLCQAWHRMPDTLCLIVMAALGALLPQD